MIKENFVTEDNLNFRKLFFLEKYMAGHHGYIAGGCFKNIFTNSKIKDVDIFFRTKVDFENAVEIFKEKIDVEPDHWKQGYKSDKVWSVIDLIGKIRLELNRSEFGEPIKILQSFDFTITKFAYYSFLNDEEDNEFEVIFQKDYFEHLQTKRLVLDDTIPFPVSTFNRSYRYQKYGYGLCRESKVKLLNAIHDLPVLNDEELGLSLYDGKD